MRVYLVRHADSLPRGVLPVDDHRYLLPEGRKQSRKIGKVLRRLGVELDGLLTSPSMQAVQTAEIVAARLKFRGRIESESALMSDAGSWDKYLAAVEKAGGRNVALVGHEPDLGIALGQALGQAAIGLPKGGLAGLERNSDGAWKALGLLRPASSDWEPIGPGREKAEGDAKALKAEKPGYPGKSGKAEKTGNLGKSGKTEKAEKAVMVTEAATPAKTAKHGKA